jgi:ATP-dependent helicase HrpB
VPPALAEAFGGEGARKVLVMEPRRVAAVAAAARIAEVWGRKLGLEVGYRVRGESRTGPRVRVEVVTPGVLVRILQDASGLEGLGCVVLDEFHERSAQADLAFALLARAREQSGGPPVLAMSATMDGSTAARALGCPVLEVPGRSFPVETRYAPLGEGRAWTAALARAALDLAAEGDVLVFLPGAAEIAQAIAAFSDLARGSAPSGPEARPQAVALHGSLSLEAQRRVLAPPPGTPPRVIFATSIAETSLTVPRVRAVLDSGLSRLTRFQVRLGLNRLVTEREAQDRADQRRGRAGRLGPGLCLRAWPQSETLANRTEPELGRAELSALVLEAALRGAPGRLDLPWLDPPPEAAWSAGAELLVGLGALTADLSPTPFGRRMAALGTEPRLAALALRGEETGEGWTACLAAALLSEGGASDIAAGLEKAASGEGPFAPVLAEARRLARAAGIESGRARPEALPSLLATAFPDRIAQRTEYRGANASFRIMAGRSMRASGPLAQSPWILALDADSGSAEGKIYSAAALSESEALSVLAGRVEEIGELEWKGLEPRLSIARRAGAISLGSRPLQRPGRAELASLLAERIAAAGLGILPWDQGADQALARLRFFAAHEPASARGGAFAEVELSEAALSDAALAARAAQWLEPHILAEAGPLLDGPALRRAADALAPKVIRPELDRLAPERIELPSGSSRPIDYRGPGGPSVEARVQEFFGLGIHPRVLGIPLALRLLDPGGKPLQVTSDLPGFWKGSWAQARKALRGRYPKHQWPEDPAAAAPSRSGIKNKRPGR